MHKRRHPPIHPPRCLGLSVGLRVGSGGKSPGPRGSSGLAQLSCSLLTSSWRPNCVLLINSGFNFVSSKSHTQKFHFLFLQNLISLS